MQEERRETITKEPIKVVVTEFDMSLGNMIGFMIKLAIAAIPAAIVIALLYTFVAGLLAGIGL